MSLALWCVLLAAILPVLTAGVAKWGAADFDNADPRGWASGLDGYRRRAFAAHQNGYEAFPLFAAAVLVAETHGSPRGLLDGLAGLYLALRLGYSAAYVADRPTVRSALWSVAFFVALAIFTLPAWW